MTLTYINKYQLHYLIYQKGGVMPENYFQESKNSNDLIRDSNNNYMNLLNYTSPINKRTLNIYISVNNNNNCIFNNNLENDDMLLICYQLTKNKVSASLSDISYISYIYIEIYQIVKLLLIKTSKKRFIK